MRKTPLEIYAEIAKLKELLAAVPRFSKFADDHHKAIKSQIETLEKSLEVDNLKRFAPDYAYEAAVLAVEWRNGTWKYAPSTDWQTLLK